MEWDDPKLVEKALARLNACADNRDTEAAHVEADDVLCELLLALGYSDVVQAYHRINKWYA